MNTERSEYSVKKLEEWQDKYQNACMAYGNESRSFERYRKQYEGSHEHDFGGAPYNHVWNFTYELLNSTINGYIPPVKVTPRVNDEKHRANARVIEELCRSEINRLPFELLNDEDERNTKIDGGSGFLIEWDNSKQSFDRVGEINIRNIRASRIIPQPGVYDLQYMDYVFVTFIDTRSNIKRKYNKDIPDDENGYNGLNLMEQSGYENETVKQVVCYYRNKEGTIGCISWVGDAVLIDDGDYQARKSDICGVCGRARPITSNKTLRTEYKSVCFCGAELWEKRPKDFEILFEDIRLSNGEIIPAASPVLDEYARVTDTKESDDPNFHSENSNLYSMQLEQTQIPYYYPVEFPIVLRRNVTNISIYDKFMGVSDCEVIKEQQHAANMLYSKLVESSVQACNIVTTPRGANIDITDANVSVIEIDNPSALAMISNIKLNYSSTQDIQMLNDHYVKAKSELRITDSFQGKPDPTAQSGRAKEAQIAQAANNQMSPLIMKRYVYSQIYEMIFKFALAYADEPRRYYGTDHNGKPIERVFNRYDFLERDDGGAWRWDDGYLFEIDSTGMTPDNIPFMFERLDVDFKSGAFGDPKDPETLLIYWRQREEIGVPGSKAMVQYWEEKIQRLQQQQIQQQTITAQQQGGAAPPPNK